MRLFYVHRFIALWRNFFFGNVTGQGARAFAVPAATSVVFFAKDWFFRSKSCRENTFSKKYVAILPKMRFGATDVCKKQH